MKNDVLWHFFLKFTEKKNTHRQTFNLAFLEKFPFTQTTLIYLLKTHDVLTHGVLCFAIKILNCF